ncbi:radical SAM/SPASM domain-containing protein [candidate division CSSED10-310 bacterium]|uniref:Radical SAM/SPASM domain-containing protein n=1 Tax=candidate division CSSED10-310 bacterium TaxID=2855610 RepID=A0ABV6YWE7_UNCC1
MAGFNDYLKFARHLFIKENTLPLYLVFFITERCVAQCKHCLLGEKRTGLTELTIAEIEKISQSLGRILFLLPTGGEPFLREDIAEIVSIFYRNNKTANVGIPTNGFFTERIVSAVENILQGCPDLDLAIDVSFDGVGEKHDIIRNVPGLFEKASTTYRELADLKKHYPKLNLNVGVTVSRYNQDHLEELYHYLTRTLGVITINHLLVRGNPADKDSIGVDPNKYEAFSKLLENGAKNQTLVGYHNYAFSDFVNAVRIVRQEVINNITRTDKQQLPCYAGSLGGVLLSNGDLYPCELLDKKIGNLREVDYDFKKLWFSARNHEIKAWIKESGCHCTYECFLTLSVFFTPTSFQHVLRQYMSLKYNRLLKKC